MDPVLKAFLSISLIWKILNGLFYLLFNKVNHIEREESPIVVNIIMNHLEASLLSKPELKLIRYTRYVADGLLVYNSDSEMDYPLKASILFTLYWSSNMRRKHWEIELCRHSNLI